MFEPVADRVLLTPHMAWYTEESEADMRRKAAAEAARLLRGEPLREPGRRAGGGCPMIHDLATMTSPEAAEAVARSRTAVLPIGSIEQHGPHLPNGTDTMAAELVAREVADRLDAVYAPFGPYGVTPIHAGHPGTVTLRRETFEALLDRHLHRADRGWASTRSCWSTGTRATSRR